MKSEWLLLNKKLFYTILFKIKTYRLTQLAVNEFQETITFIDKSIKYQINHIIITAVNYY
jgi:hypothetical protein